MCKYIYILTTHSESINYEKLGTIEKYSQIKTLEKQKIDKTIIITIFLVSITKEILLNMYSEAFCAV